MPVPDGQLFLDGADINRLPLNQLRGDIAMVPQEGFLFTSTLADNLRYGEPGAADAQVELAAERARLSDDVRGFPDGFSTIVGERGITLSGGQRQRTALGRALLVSAPVLVLDDALASVDNNTAAGFTIVNVFAYDKMGLLYSISRCLYDLKLEVHLAKITTHVDQVVDVFYVTDRDGQKIESREQTRDIREQLLAAIKEME